MTSVKRRGGDKEWQGAGRARAGSGVRGNGGRVEEGGQDKG